MPILDFVCCSFCTKDYAMLDLQAASARMYSILIKIIVHYIYLLTNENISQSWKFFQIDSSVRYSIKNIAGSKIYATNNTRNQ